MQVAFFEPTFLRYVEMCEICNVRLIHTERNSTGEIFVEAECSYLVRGVGLPGMQVCCPYRRRLGEGQIRCVRRYTECLAFTRSELIAKLKCVNCLICEF